MYFADDELVGIDLEHWRSDVMTITIDNPLYVGAGRSHAAEHGARILPPSGRR